MIAGSGLIRLGLHVVQRFAKKQLKSREEKEKEKIISKLHLSLIS